MPPSPVRACYIRPSLLRPTGEMGAVFDRCAGLGFDTVVLPCPFVGDGAWARARLADPDRLAAVFAWPDDAEAGLARLAELARGRGLRLMLDIRLDEVAGDASIVLRQPHWFRPRRASDGAPPDPRRPAEHAESAVARFDHGPHAGELVHWWGDRLRGWHQAGVSGFRCLWPQRLPAADWRSIIEGVHGPRDHADDDAARFLAWTPGLKPDEWRALAGSGFDAAFSSLPWWDFRADWYLHEDERLRQFPAAIVPVDDPLRGDVPTAATNDDLEAQHAARRRAIAFAAMSGDGLLVALDERSDPLLDAALIAANTQLAARGIARRNGLRPLLGGNPGPAVAWLLERVHGDGDNETEARVLLANADSRHIALVDVAELLRNAGDFSLLRAPAPAAPLDADAAIALEPAEVRCYSAERAAPITVAAKARPAVAKAMTAPRLAIERVAPVVDDGRFAAKRIIGERVTVQADVFCDGHDLVAAAVLWRAAGARQWKLAPMRDLGNDRWCGEFTPDRVGRHEFVVEAWRDVFGTARMDLEKKRAAGKLTTLDVDEVCQLVSDAAARSRKSGDADAAPVARVSAAHPGQPGSVEARGTPGAAGGLTRATRADQSGGGDAASVARVSAAHPGQPGSVEAHGTPGAADGLTRATRTDRSGAGDAASVARVSEAHPGQPESTGLSALADQLAAASSDDTPAGNATLDSRRATLLVSPEMAQAMARADNKPFLTRHPTVFTVDVERRAAGYGSWYELFPRSQSQPGTDGEPQRHGTFDDVVARLPAVRAMGFDVLYLPPIHPIGRINRKGRNNAVTAQPDDPGSPYAIGAKEGGHDAIHPELGTLEDFRRLVAAAAGQGLEVALDFAIQCSPDHPWLREHPDWFAWRADGSIRYAENPPKKYEDIVNVEFYGDGDAGKGSVPDLWLALRDVVAFWVDQGVRLFRVDNPHTKPFPFWEWLIADIRARDPGVVFLAEAFTRPKVMYRLAKLGFAQSYTYFTWRNAKQELTDYLEELAQGEPRDYFRPHFFVNTPDINPVYLQTGGRAGHLVRAALATTLSGLWGMYSGFELCEATPLPGKEEYLDSEKYQLRAWDWQRPGHIIDEITRLNLLRRLNPALQTHLGITFYNAFNDQILYFGKRHDAADDMLLVAINLDPHHAQEADFELPLWEWGLPDHASLQVEDLWRGTRTVWHGKMQHLRLDPGELPFAIWRVGPPGAEA